MCHGHAHITEVVDNCRAILDCAIPPFPCVMHVYYIGRVQNELDWRHRGSYIAKHDMTPEWADEAFADPNRVVIDPDPASHSGRTIRVIGWSVSIQLLVTVIALPDKDVTWGVNAWRSNSTDQRRYREENADED